MTDKAVEILKIFLEKHLIPTVIGIATSIGMVAIFPNLFQLEERVEKTGYGILCFCIVFLGITLIRWLIERIQNCKYLSNMQKQHNDEIAKQNLEALENIWSYVDKLCPEDRDILRELLVNKNQPIIHRGRFAYCRLLSNDEIVVSTELNNGQTKYRLTDEFYRALEYSMREYGRISHFNEY